MRLTLRTMLAYLDDVLDADDSAELGRKIEESEFASGLVQRIRNSMNRPQLESPPVEGRGMGHDPNTVAEYLDNTLPAERMPDFERVCLESDSHLAEAASCHQVLTLVLGESAAVPAEMRQRMYRMGSQVSETEAPPVQPPPAQEAAQGAAAGVPSQAGAALDAPTPARKGRRNKPEVPDYIKTRSSFRLWPLALVILLLVGLAGATYMALQGDFFGTGEPVAHQQPEENEVPDKGEGAGEPRAGEPEDMVGAADQSDDANAVAGDEEELAGEGAAAAAGEGLTAEEPAVAAGEGEEVTPPTEAAEAGDEQVAGTGGGETPAEDLLPGDRVASADGPGIPGVTEAVPGAAEQEKAELGRYTSDRQVLLRYNNEEGTWWRLPQQTILSAGETWLAPPSFRPQLTLASGLQLTLDGPTRVTMLPSGTDEAPALDVAYGKVVIVSIGRPGARLRLQMGDRTGELVLVDAASTCAIEVMRYLDLGANPEQSESFVVSRIFCTRGSVTWLEDGEGPQDVVAGNLIETVANLPSNIGAYLNQPAWIAGENLSGPDQLASTYLAPLLEDDRPADLALQELANSRRAEVRALAARSLCYLGVYEPAIAGLGDSNQRSNWSNHFDALRDALSRSPEAAAEVRTTLERKRMQDAEALYRMLWGYNVQDLENGADAELVAALEAEALDMRVLALENLYRITNVTHIYRPEASEGNRSQPVREWKEDLAAGAIRPPAPAVSAPADAESAPAEGGGEAAQPGDPATVQPPMVEAEAGVGVEGYSLFLRVIGRFWPECGRCAPAQGGLRSAPGRAG